MASQITGNFTPEIEDVSFAICVVWVCSLVQAVIYTPTSGNKGVGDTDSVGRQDDAFVHRKAPNSFPDDAAFLSDGLNARGTITYRFLLQPVKNAF